MNFLKFTISLTFYLSVRCIKAAFYGPIKQNVLQQPSYHHSSFNQESLRLDSSYQKDQHWNDNTQNFIHLTDIAQRIGSGDLREGLGNIISAAVQSAAPESCAAEIGSQGYVNKDLDEDDYAFIPNCNRPTTETESISCFHGESVVLTPSGKIRLKDLKTGMKVATHHTKQTDKVTLQYNPVLFFLHKDKTIKHSSWITLVWKVEKKGVHEQTGKLTVSPYHLIKTFQHYMNAEGNFGQKVSFVAAKRVKVGDQVEVVQNVTSSQKRIETQVIHANVISIYGKYSTNQKHEGLYAPVTVKGTLIVDNIIASQYSTLPQIPPYFDDIVHYSAHKLLRPLYKLIQTLHTFIPDSCNIYLASGIEMITFHLRILTEKIIQLQNYNIFSLTSNRVK
ncbi:uncharacterized protein LOC128883890 [Hylaeus volcanicus]|uniref:uncharacterized protein LOC128883890 n=1 Tax=Hylaeus volcanicus TaxID=313075 RepID=UPI0023B7784A|nr:uncharacterized protein LOC128883890 [Hylaeus volcanicus]